MNTGSPKACPSGLYACHALRYGPGLPGAWNTIRKVICVPLRGGEWRHVASGLFQPWLSSDFKYAIIMNMNNPATTLNCTQCGGELHPDEGQIFLVCPYCSATVYVDKRRVVFHWSVAPTLSADQATAALYRWMSGSPTVKDLDHKSQITGRDFQYFPLWFFKFGAKDREETALEPAAATSVSELANLNIPAGDLRKYDPALDDASEPPSVPLEAAL